MHLSECHKDIEKKKDGIDYERSHYNVGRSHYNIWGAGFLMSVLHANPSLNNVNEIWLFGYNRTSEDWQP